MKKGFAIATTFAFVAAFAPVSDAQQPCPAEVTKAKQLLAQKSSIARGQDQQAPRSLAGARGQDQQAPRGQDQQAPRSLAGAKAGGLSKAATLVREAEAACKAGNMAQAKAKAEAALAELQ
jgi:hypothetical protein